MRQYIYNIKKDLSLVKTHRSTNPVGASKKYSDDKIEDMIVLFKNGRVSNDVARLNGFKNSKHATDIIYSRTGKRLRDLRE